MKQIWVLLISFLLSFSVFSEEIILTKDNTLVLAQEFDSKTVGDLMQEAAKMDAALKSGYPMYLILYTPGGSIQDGLELFDFLNGIHRPVHTITLFAASMGFQAVQHLGKRYITRYGVLMSHKARGGFQGEFGDGLSSVDSRYGMWLRRVAFMDEITVKRTNGKQTLQTYRAAYSNELWLNGAEAVVGGYADEVVTPQCSEGLKSSTREVEVEGFFMKALVTFSGCPLNTNPIKVEAIVATNKGFIPLNEFIAKNGKFGTACQDTDTEVSTGYGYGRSTSDTAVKPAELCASDKTLDIEKIKKFIDDQRQFFSRDLRNHIKYSY